MARDYARIVRRVERLASPDVSCQVLGEVEGLPVFCITASREDSLPGVYLSGGTHGDEPAGVECTLAFLEDHFERWLDRFQFEVIPCLNPYGYVHNTRLNARGVDINWAFKRDDVPEIGLLRDFVAGKQFVAGVDLHEDWESPGFYMYEMFRGFDPPGQTVVKRVSEVCPLNMNAEIEQEVAVNGVIHPSMEIRKRCLGEGIPIALFQEGYTDYLVTLETPTEKPVDVRIQAHLTALEAILEAREIQCPT